MLKFKDWGSGDRISGDQKLKKHNTVKLAYNELGYNKLPVITNKFDHLVG